MIESRRLGETGLSVSSLGLGGATLGNLYTPVADEDARETIAAALDAGINLIDVAPYYGFGLAERRVGDAVRGRDVVVSTKVGRLLTPLSNADPGRLRHGFASALPFEPRFDYTGDGILRSHEASLQRLGLARVDLLLIHDIGERTHGAQGTRRLAELTSGGGIASLERLKREGAITAWGLGVNETEVCLDVMAHARPDVILLAGRYTLLEQSALERLFPAAQEAGIAILIGGPFNSGILAGADTYDYVPAPAAVRARVGALRKVAARHGVPLAAAALQFVLAHRTVASVIPGSRSADEVRGNLDHLAVAIPAAFWRELKDAKLIAGEAPVPA